jgi:hypothetical protein
MQHILHVTCILRKLEFIAQATPEYWIRWDDKKLDISFEVKSYKTFFPFVIQSMTWNDKFLTLYTSAGNYRVEPLTVLH